MKKRAAPEFFKFSASRMWCLGVAVCLLFPKPFAARATELQTLKGHVPAAVARLRTVGHLPGTNELRLAIGLPLRNQAELTHLLAQIYNPASTNYHHFLTPAQFAGRFGPSPADYESVQAFANANGLKITGTSANRTLLDVAGPASLVEQVFHVQLRQYPHPREARYFFAPDTEPSLNLTVPILHISGLDNFIVPHPMNLVRQTQVARPSDRSWAGSGTSGSYWGNDFRAAYVPGTVMTGLGQKVGLLQMKSGFFPSDITRYETNTGLPNVPVTPVLLDGYSGGPGDYNDECSLDIEMSISMAPGLSQVLVYEGSVADDILNQMATDNSAKQLSSSYSFAVDAGTEQTFQQFAAQGQSFFNASGDGNTWVGGVTPPCDDPNITIVGGTTLTTTNGAWLSETVWRWDDTNGSGGGISTEYSIPAWQQGIDMTENQGSTTMRNIPDVALTADNIYVAFGDGTNGVFGGTSCAAPLWAGFTALMNQQAANNGGSPVGFVNPAIYVLGQQANYTNQFHDIVTGNNTNDFSADLFFAVPGYDLCTGWGTPAGQSLIDALVGPADPTPVSIITQPQSQAGIVGASVTFGVLVGGLPPFEYQWSFNGTNLVGATNDILTLDDVQMSQAGNYTVSVTNAFGSAHSSVAVLTVNQAAPCDPDPSGLVSWWPGEGNANDIIGTNNGVLEGGIGIAPGEVGQGFSFGDPSDDVRIPASASLDVGDSSGSFTVEAWVNCSTISQLNPIFEWNNGDGTYGAHFYVWSDGTLYANIFDASFGAHIMHQSPVVITAGTFYHVALTYDNGSGVGAIYCNGQIVDQETLGQFTPSTSYDLYLGRRPFTQGSAFTFSGVLDEPSLYNRALTAQEIAGIYNAGAGGKCLPSGTAPIISTQPSSQTVDVGSNAVFSVGVSGMPNLTYQWLFDETNVIAGATDSMLVLTNVQMSEAGFYSVTISNSLGFVVSSNAQLTVLAFPPTIQTQPTNQTLDVGDTAVLEVAVTGSSPLFYQWTFQGTNLIGATNASLLLADVQIDQGGIYNVLVTNQFGSVLSSNAVLTVVGIPPTITFQPTNETVAVGNTAVLGVAAAGSNPLFYQWTFQGTNLVGATNASLRLANVQIGQAGVYNVLVTNQFGSMLSSNAVLAVVGIPPTFTIQPVNLTVRQGNLAVFEVSASGTAPLSYQWLFQGVFLNGATNANLIMQNVQFNQDGTYNVFVFNAFGSLVSSNAVLTVLAPPLILAQPTNQTVLLGANVSFAVTATGSLPLSYHWYFNGTTSLTTTTNGVLTLTNIGTAQAGNYSVQISNAYGQVASSNALLSVFVPPQITAQPTNLNLTVGATATFTVTATGSTNLAYQWYWNTNNPILRATNATLTLTNVQTNNIGVYSVLVTNIAGSAASSNAVLLVNLGYHFTWTTIPSPRFVNVPFAITIQAKNLTNNIVTSFTGAVNFSSSLGLPVQPPWSGPFVRGTWTGSVSVGQTTNNLVLQAIDGFGDLGLANPINIVATPGLGGLRSGTSLLLFWPTNIPGFVVETSPRLNSTNWAPTSQSFEFGNTNVEIIDTTGSNAFYRLRYTNP